MKISKVIIGWLAFALMSCAVVPLETVTLSKKLGDDLKIIRQSHVNAIDIQFNRMISDINTFVDEVYGPFVIHDVLSSELEAFNKKEHSIYGVIDTAGMTRGKKESDLALAEMSDFVQAARARIEAKRTELLTPIFAQQAEIINGINQSYTNLVHANATITGYLESIRKVKDAQQEALKTIGLENLDKKATDALIQASEVINKAIEAGTKIDVKSDKAEEQFTEFSEKIKSVFNRK